jgi:hypothetical protein
MSSQSENRYNSAFDQVIHFNITAQMDIVLQNQYFFSQTIFNEAWYMLEIWRAIYVLFYGGLYQPFKMATYKKM